MCFIDLIKAQASKGFDVTLNLYDHNLGVTSFGGMQLQETGN
jgi:hypothetical protein